MVRSPRNTALLILGFAVSLAACSSPTGTTSGVVEIGVSKSTEDRPIESSLDDGGSGISDVIATAGGKVDALAVANRLVVANEYPSGYERDYFRHWVTVDAAGCSAREHVLKQESITLPQVDSPCYVVAGDWYSAYDGITLSDRAEVDIDHMVPLKEAWDSGAWRWDAATRERYANDVADRRSLIAVTGSSNGSKSDNDPSQWMPSVSSYRCKYLGDWVAVKARWNLTMDSSESGYVKKQLRTNCAGLKIAKIKKASIGFGPLPSPTTTSSSGNSGDYVATEVQAGWFCKTDHRGQYGLASNGRRVQCADSGSGWRWKYA